MLSALALYICQPVTWSVDTTGIVHPGRSTVAIRRALGQWSGLTGLKFDYVPSGGQVSIVFRPVGRGWAAYALEDTIVIDPGMPRRWPHLLERTVAHEMAHVLGVGHVQHGNSIVSDEGFIGSARVTPADAQLVRIQPCD